MVDWIKVEYLLFVKLYIFGFFCVGLDNFLRVVIGRIDKIYCCIYGVDFVIKVLLWLFFYVFYKG